MTKRDAKPRGRPRAEPGEGKEARVEMRTTPERKAKALRLAQAADLSLTQWWEKAIDRARE